MNIYKQKPNTDWTDEAGNHIMYSQLNKKEKVNEVVCYNVANAALKAHNQLKKLKQYICESIEKAKAAFHAQYSGKKTEFKGNYTIYNFDQSIKLEVSVSNPIKFDDMTIQKAKSLLDEFLKEGISAKNATIKDMVLDAFETTRGKMDVKKIMGLKRYADRVKDDRYTEAMKLIDSAIRRPDTAVYYRVSVRNDKGQYENIALSLADV